MLQMQVLFSWPAYRHCAEAGLQKQTQCVTFSATEEEDPCKHGQEPLLGSQLPAVAHVAAF